MNIFKFTKLRKRLFVRLLIVFLGIPLLCVCGLILGNYLKIFLMYHLPTGSILFEIYWKVWNVYLQVGLIVFVFFFLMPAHLTYLLGFGEVCFERGVLLIPFTPKFLGWVVTIIFYFILAFLLSWFGNLKKDSKLNEKD